MRPVHYLAKLVRLKGVDKNDKELVRVLNKYQIPDLIEKDEKISILR